MSKFSLKAENTAVNKSGHAAYAMTDRTRLVTQVLTSFFNEEKFYGDNSDEITDTLIKVINSDPEFVSKLAVFARREFNMRSIAHVITAYLAHEPAGKPFVRDTVKGIALRGDDLTETMAFYLERFGKPVPNSLKKGVNDVIVNFDEYTLAKYKGDRNTFKMRDLICLCRPTPKNDEQSEMWKRCIEGNLRTPVTWETELSAKGNNKETWEYLIDSGKVGYMALLRNLRNIIKADPCNIEKVYKTIEDPEAVRHSKQLPFRFLSAYSMLGEIGTSRTFDALETAAELSCANIGTIPGKTVIAVDTSGSMGAHLSRKSTVSCCNVAMLLGLIANKICEESIFVTFDLALTVPSYSKKNPLLFTALHGRGAGGGTNMYLPFEYMIQKRVRADRIIILSDTECNYENRYVERKTVQSLADQYRRASKRDIWVHAIDLMGYGTQQFRGDRTNIIAGWSEKVFEFIMLAEQGAGTLENRISGYTW